MSGEDDPALVALGRLAFRRYPVQLAPYLRVALASPAAAARFGLWVDDARGLGGLVRARMADGSGALMVTCSTCHSTRADGDIADGVPNMQLDTGAARRRRRRRDRPRQPHGWLGRGHLDVSTTTGTEPVRIPDLRPVRWLTFLQQDATVRKTDLRSLAIRIETLIVTSHNQATRPSRVVALGLAAYLASLADALPAADPAASAHPAGAVLFAEHCAACHAGAGLTGTPVALDVVGTDPVDGESTDRGTGTYRVPSLRGVSTRGPLLHDGTVPTVAAMLDPARPTAGFAARLHGSGAVTGHPFGLDLDDADRSDLLAYLIAL